MGFLGMLLLPKCSPDLKYGPWPPDATGVALYLALLVADWLLYKRLCPSICLWVCVNKWRKQAFPAHPSGTGIGFVLSFLVKTNHFLYNKNDRFKNNLFLCLPNAYKWCFIPSPCSVYETPKMAFLKCQKWCFWNTKNGVSETPKMAFLKRQKWCFWNAKSSVSKTIFLLFAKHKMLLLHNLTFMHFRNAKSGPFDTRK